MNYKVFFQYPKEPLGDWTTGEWEFFANNEDDAKRKAKKLFGDDINILCVSEIR